METEHQIHVGNSNDMAQIGDSEVDLVVTSPPYPMIEMWDDLFRDLNPDIGNALQDGDGRSAFELMHAELRKTWEEVKRVLVPGGVACINIGDATRKIGGSFQVYSNHAEVITAFLNLGFESLPDVLWRKPANSGAKFMGSGMLPPNAYVTLEHEYILVFRNGSTQRQFEPGSTRRYNSAYFWEERNEWFSDVWMDIRGTLQKLDRGELRQRSGAFPFELPHRLINMYSVYQDTVLDPFWGTGTTTMSAMAAGRNSIGYEIEPEFTSVFEDRIDTIKNLSLTTATKRIQSHHNFVEQRLNEGKEFKYDATYYNFPVTTKQEQQIQFQAVESVVESENGYNVQHIPVEDPSEAKRNMAIRPDLNGSQSTLGSEFN